MQTHRPSIDELRGPSSPAAGPSGPPVPAGSCPRTRWRGRGPISSRSSAGFTPRRWRSRRARPTRRRARRARAHHHGDQRPRGPTAARCPCTGSRRLDWKAYAVSALRLHALDHRAQIVKAPRRDPRRSVTARDATGMRSRVISTRQPPMKALPEELAAAREPPFAPDYGFRIADVADGRCTISAVPPLVRAPGGAVAGRCSQPRRTRRCGWPSPRAWGGRPLRDGRAQHVVPRRRAPERRCSRPRSRWGPAACIYGTAECIGPGDRL